KDRLTGVILAKGVKVSQVSNTDTTLGTANTIVTLSTGLFGAQSYEIQVILDGAGSYTNDVQLNDPVAAGYATSTLTVMQPSVLNTMKGAGTIASNAASAVVYTDTSS